MNPQSTKAVLAVLLSATVSLIAALPQVTDATSPNPTVFWPWSSHPACVSSPTACKANCTAAVESLCAKDLKTDNLVETVGECTANYLRQIGNTVPTADQCFSAFAYINDAGKPGPNGCGGTFGGALGWDKHENRTRDPIFAIYPKGGNANCFKKLGDNGPPLPQDTLRNGKKIPIDSCPSPTARHKRNALRTLEKKAEEDGFLECVVEDGVWQVGCNAVCIELVVATAVTTGPFAWPLGLACFGGCDATGYKLVNNCQEHKHKLKTRAEPDDPCSNINRWAFQCPAVRLGMLSLHNCSGSSAADAATGVAHGGNGDINF